MVLSKNMAKPSRSDPARAFPFPEGIMPRKPRHPCGYPGCPELTERQYCPAHEKIVSSQYNRYGRTPEMKRRYNSAWPRIRRRLLPRTRCARCACGKAGRRRRRKSTTSSRWQTAVRMTRAISCRCAGAAIPASRPPREGAGAGPGAPQGARKSQNERPHIAGPPLRVRFRAFKWAYRPLILPNDTEILCPALHRR